VLLLCFMLQLVPSWHQLPSWNGGLRLAKANARSKLASLKNSP
jgi:hypothetical protein